ncbi:MAG TPA: hypothetical protein VMW50_10275 [Dehalococcoidia bacterium]|nr:hypothetical protein [Dehalococcoidia bacterium]
MQLKNFRITNRREKWHTCALCGGDAYKRIQVKFTSGGTEPEEDEVITTASGATGIVTDTTIFITSGSWAGADAEGYLELSGATGVSDELWGVDEEIVSGSVGGADMFTLDGQGIEKAYGIMYPLSHLSEYDGKWYCLEHLRLKAGRDELDEAMVEITELERGTLP